MSQEFTESTTREQVDQTRLRVMFDEHFDAVFRALRRAGLPTAELQDCTQEVFIIVSKKLSAILPGRERAFLLSIAEKVAKHARRQQRRCRWVLHEDPYVETMCIDPALRPDDIVEAYRQRILLEDIIVQIPQKLRVVFVSFEIDELTIQQIASLTCLPMGSVASRLRRAREEFARIASRTLALAEGRHQRPSSFPNAR